MSIGETSRSTGLSIDTLRYYEKIGLLPRVARDPGGRRCFHDADLSRLRFIRRAQACNFSLEEIRQMLALRDTPEVPRPEVQHLTEQKLAEIEQRLADLDRLKRELELLLNLCRTSQDGCPIIDSLGGE
ncbi:putative transcriptional regulator [Salinisphaera sp. PC39]